MKKNICLFLIAAACAKSYAGICIISGQQNNATGNSFRLYMLYAGAHYHNQFVDIIPDKEGKFRQPVELPYPIFALLKYNGFERRLILSPGRNLHIVFDGKQGTDSFNISGRSAPENRLLFDLKIGDEPFFMKENAAINAKLPVGALQKNILDVLKAQYADVKKMITSAEIPRQLQQILLTEIHYSNQCYLYDLAGYYMRSANNKDQPVFLENVMRFEPLPDSITLVTCLYANMSLEYFARYALINAAKDIRTDSTAAMQRLGQMFGMPFNEVSKLAEKYGERYIISWLYAKNNLPAPVRDKILFNRIIESCDSKELTNGLMLLDTMQYYFPNSNYLPMAKNELHKLEKIQQAQLHNDKIIVHEGEKITSFSELAKLHAGKIIYVDIWGTWCGPCRMEMAYVPDLKKKFAGENIVFVYIDMDKASKEDLWKEVLHLHALEGEHYRLSSDEIEPLWKEIETAGGQTNLYPTYVLFDKSGKMVKPNAKRPSDGKLLYEEIGTVLR